MRIIPLSEGAFTVDKTKQFVPFDLSKDNLQERGGGALLVEIQPFLIITDQDYILLDTGLGFRNANGVLQLHQHLIDHGINPMDISKVLMSHLHKDHAGGVSYKDPLTGERLLTFPQATYYVNTRELQYALENDGKSYLAEEVAILQQRDNVIFIDGEGAIDGYIHYQFTGGHCPYHQVFLIKQDGETIFYGGDVAPQLSQMKSRFVAKYDYDGKRCMELRQQYLAQGKQEGWTFLFYHDVRTPFAKM
ncbi:Glyoxylase, beta-lactamase superfamily II [Chitinophaga costaii]|uniref:Glyoxylase, beta-lactamase superfamily II n=1 Tax=Chitinophaga costaii TaxID=1335309 RepID=A0A1C4DP82_9BACT|nr:MBL fold metallo-hydrolase [Chitinophaga costaii]PUZ27724.1 MBL fold metallo-hydrolase [Chitinophaga costaii]SCC33186.1 Glyoxylase, beta-lactamase superfamily II [Chitinophaga costaii]